MGSNPVSIGPSICKALTFVHISTEDFCHEQAVVYNTKMSVGRIDDTECNYVSQTATA